MTHQRPASRILGQLVDECLQAYEAIALLEMVEQGPGKFVDDALVYDPE